jgi:pimeloyl-ACP methyl ester carboxylesterase
MCCVVVLLLVPVVGEWALRRASLCEWISRRRGDTAGHGAAFACHVASGGTAGTTMMTNAAAAAAAAHYESTGAVPAVSSVRACRHSEFSCATGALGPLRCAMTPTGARGLLSSVAARCPMLVIHGSADGHAAAIAAACAAQGVRCVEVAAAAHTVHVQHAVTVATHISAWRGFSDIDAH